MADIKKTITIRLTREEIAEAVAEYASKRFYDDGPFDGQAVTFECSETANGAPFLECAEITA